ncbi:MAG TPA: hypothetical protein DIW77_05075 [Chromatiaceae bacterium]|nr:MAG: hypothetical protein N838_21040 [Thiohalocapsa sp. PB-PSB1]HCS89437.1 hypothetical protein [Chromatiaceae bacterium]
MIGEAVCELFNSRRAAALTFNEEKKDTHQGEHSRTERKSGEKKDTNGEKKDTHQDAPTRTPTRTERKRTPGEKNEEKKDTHQGEHV